MNQISESRMELPVTRREWIKVSAAFAAAISTQDLLAAKMDPPLEIIDCHTHFYDPSRAEGVPWPAKNTSLYRTVLPQNLRELPQYRPVTGTVVVEASPWVEDNQWLLDLAKDDPFVVGIVGNLNPGVPEFAEHANRLAKNPLFRGIRVSSKRVNELLMTGELDDFRRLADLDLSLDVNGGPDSPQSVAMLAQKVPQLRMVQNHIGNVVISADAPPEDWVSAIQAAAACPNVFCKISALVEGAARVQNPVPTEPDFYRPYIDVVWNAFGEDRVIYGSNWPVSERASSYAFLQQLSMDYASSRSKSALVKFCSVNASKAYKWVDRPGRKAT